MPLDGITLHGLKRELREHLLGGWVRKIYQPRKDLTTIHIWNNDDFLLLISCGDDFRIQLSELDFENPQSPPPFSMLMRKHLSGGKITGISQIGLDRIIRISVQVKPEKKNREQFKTLDIYVELLGRNSNLVLVQDGEVLGTLRSKQGGQRDLSTGETYNLPPAQGKTNPFEIDRNEFNQVFKSSDSIWKRLMNQIEGIGPTIAKEIPIRAEISPDKTELSSQERSQLWKETKELFAPLSKGEFSPRVYEQEEKPVDFTPVELESYKGKRSLSFESLSAALDYFYKSKETGREKEQLREDLGEVLENQKARIEGAQKNVKEQLDKSKSRNEFKKIGDVILANLSELERGMSQATVQDPYEQNRTIEVSLDPSLSPEQNAEKYYEKYKKLKRGKEKLERRSRFLKREFELVSNLQNQLKEAEKQEELAEIKGKLIEKGYLEKEEEDQDKSERQGGPKEYHLKGCKILVGRNARQNDELVRKASRDDLWFHVRDYAGAHVIVVSDGKPDQIPGEVIRKAAKLAALNSKARNASKVQVSYTQTKYVDKPKGAKPGLVRISNEKTVTVSPREEE